MLLRSAIGSLLCTSTLAANLFAHPGHVSHVEQPNALSHYLFHPDHLIVWMLAVAAGAIIWWTTRRRTRELVPAYARAVKIKK